MRTESDNAIVKQKKSEIPKGFSVKMGLIVEVDVLNMVFETRMTVTQVEDSVQKKNCQQLPELTLISYPA